MGGQYKVQLFVTKERVVDILACLGTCFEKGDSSFIGEVFALCLGNLPAIIQITFVPCEDNRRIFITIFHLMVNSN